METFTRYEPGNCRLLLFKSQHIVDGYSVSVPIVTEKMQAAFYIYRLYLGLATIQNISNPPIGLDVQVTDQD